MLSDNGTNFVGANEELVGGYSHILPQAGREYRIEQNFGGTKFWRNCDFETLAEKFLANPRLACIFIIVRAR